MVLIVVPLTLFLPSHLFLFPAQEMIRSPLKAFVKSRKNSSKGAEIDFCVSFLKNVHRNWRSPYLWEASY